LFFHAAKEAGFARFSHSQNQSSLMRINGVAMPHCATVYSGGGGIME
jgi:hypothetical protein